MHVSWINVGVSLTVAPRRIFIWGLQPRRSGRRKSTVGFRGEVWGTKLKQSADIVYRFWLQKRSTFENFTQFTSWFLTSMYISWLGAKWPPIAPPLAHVWSQYWLLVRLQLWDGIKWTIEWTFDIFHKGEAHTVQIPTLTFIFYILCRLFYDTHLIR